VPLLAILYLAKVGFVFQSTEAGLKTQHYEIRVEGCLGSSWSDWFEGLVVGHEKDARGEPVRTVLSGTMDQAMLHGVLAKVRDLGLTLIAVNQRTQREQ
jgi:hypothetical protein